MPNKEDCNCNSDVSYTQKYLDDALAKQAETFQQKLDDQAKEAKEEREELTKKYTAVNDELVAIKDKKAAQKLVKQYAALLPDKEFEAENPKAVLVKACGNMLKEGTEYSVPDMIKIADDLLLERGKAEPPKPKSESFSRLPDTRFQGDVLLDLIVNR